VISVEHMIPVVCTDRGRHTERKLDNLTRLGVGFVAFPGIPQRRTVAKRCPSCPHGFRWRPETARHIYETLKAQGIPKLDVSLM
jgi:hypothetical protein